MALIPKQERKDFVSILSSDATLRQVVSREVFDEYKGNKEERHFEDTKGNKGTKLEIIHESISGVIEEIKFVDTEFGKLLQINLIDFPMDEILSLSTSSPYGEDFMKKLPNIDLSQPVNIKPYCFTPDNKDKEIKGISITQGPNKITNAFYDMEAKIELKGFPKPEGDTKKYTKDDWKIHFLQVRKFLVKYIEDNFVNKSQVTETIDELADKMNIAGQYPTENINPEDIPW